MNKLISFVRLDFVTIKPYLTVRTILLFGAAVITYTIISENIAAGVGIGMMMIGVMFVSYPFAVGDRCNIDALYTTLSIKKKTVVLGRYLFGLTLNLCGVLFSVIVCMIGRLISQYTNLTIEVSGMFAAIFLLFLMFIFIQAIQLPIYFKFGYTKAKFFSIIPLILIMVGYTTLTAAESSSMKNGIYELIDSMNNNSIIALGALIIIILVFVSCRLSIAVYQKREF